jgi:RNA polymerase sigma-70 factor (ECF subfamily)
VTTHNRSDTDHPARGQAWFEALFASHSPAVRAFARRRIGDDADDAVAEVFTTAWLRRDVVPDHALPWLYRTLSHHVLHLQRTSARHARTVEAVAGQPQPDTADPANGVASSVDDRALVASGLARLTPDDRELLRLWAWEHLDVADLAYVLNVSSGTARVRLHRARRRLRAALQDLASAAETHESPWASGHTTVRPFIVPAHEERT